MSVIDEYLDKLNGPEKAEFQTIHRIVHETVPDAQEVISYGMPGFKYQGKYLIGFAAFKGHLSLFPTSGPIEELQAKLAGFTLTKGTIQFTVNKPIPESLIKELLLCRAKVISEM
jgi:uncharacterized protein YdhG (YjbR/CyaY superfamily)